MLKQPIKKSINKYTTAIGEFTLLVQKLEILVNIPNYQQKTADNQFKVIKENYNNLKKQYLKTKNIIQSQDALFIIESFYQRAKAIYCNLDIEELKLAYVNVFKSVYDHLEYYSKQNKEFDQFNFNYYKSNGCFCLASLFTACCKKNTFPKNFLDNNIKNFKKNPKFASYWINILASFLGLIQVEKEKSEFLKCNLEGVKQLKKIFTTLKESLLGHEEVLNHDESSVKDLFKWLSEYCFGVFFSNQTLKKEVLNSILLENNILKASPEKIESCISWIECSIILNENYVFANLFYGVFIQNNALPPRDDYLPYIEKAEANELQVVDIQHKSVFYSMLSSVYDDICYEENYRSEKYISYLKKLISYTHQASQYCKDVYFKTKFCRFVLQYQFDFTDKHLEWALAETKQIFTQYDIRQNCIFSDDDFKEKFSLVFYYSCWLLYEQWNKNGGENTLFNIFDMLKEKEIKNVPVEMSGTNKTSFDSTTPISYKSPSDLTEFFMAKEDFNYKHIRSNPFDLKNEYLEFTIENLNKARAFIHLYLDINVLKNTPGHLDLKFLQLITEYSIYDEQTVKQFLSVLLCAYNKYRNHNNKLIKGSLFSKFAHFIYLLLAIKSEKLVFEYCQMIKEISETIFEKAVPKLIVSFSKAATLKDLENFYAHLAKINDIDDKFLEADIELLESYNKGSELLKKTINLSLDDKSNLIFFHKESQKQVEESFKKTIDLINEKNVIIGPEEIIGLIKELNRILLSKNVTKHAQQSQILKKSKESFLKLLRLISDIFNIDVTCSDLLTISHFYRTLSLVPTEVVSFYLTHWIDLLQRSFLKLKVTEILDLLPCLIHVPCSQQQSAQLLELVLAFTKNDCFISYNEISVRNQIYFLFTLVVLMHNSKQSDLKNVKNDNTEKLIKNCILSINILKPEAELIALSQLNQCYWLLKDTLYNECADMIHDKFHKNFKRPKSTIHTSQMQQEITDALQKFLGKDVNLLQEHLLEELLTVDVYFEKCKDLPYPYVVVHCDAYHHFNSDLSDNTTITYKQKNLLHDSMLMKMKPGVKIIRINIDAWQQAKETNTEAQLFNSLGLKKVQENDFVSFSIELNAIRNIFNK